jgi:hypothetical protein
MVSGEGGPIVVVLVVVVIAVVVVLAVVVVINAATCTCQWPSHSASSSKATAAVNLCIVCKAGSLTNSEVCEDFCRRGRVLEKLQMLYTWVTPPPLSQARGHSLCHYMGEMESVP